jgi:hypothetical protein
MSRMPDSPAAPNEYAHARPKKHPLAPSASAFNTSRLERMPPSINTGTLQSTVTPLFQPNALVALLLIGIAAQAEDPGAAVSIPNFSVAPQ